MVETILSNLNLGADGIYSYDFDNQDQADEAELRSSVASNSCKDYLQEISKHHSIPVMDREVAHFLCSIPKNGLIVDVGGCWGWHWRHISSSRPDVTVFIVDFIRGNLIHAKSVLGQHIGRNVFLVHGDATSLIFSDNTFDGWWSVQTLQHIPDYKKAISEAWRVLKVGGVFANYSLNSQALVKSVYRLIGRDYHIKGNIPGSFYLARASREQLKQVEEVFFNKCRVRFSEVIFSPELKFASSGRENSFLGKLDSFLSLDIPVFSWIARQQSFHTTKVSA